MIANKNEIGLHACDMVRIKRVERLPRSSSGKFRVGVLLLGSIHGNEPAGYEFLSWLAETMVTSDIMPSTAVWVVPTTNPCGLARGVREHPVRKVDLNRSFGVTKQSPQHDAPPAVDWIRLQIDTLAEKCDHTWVLDAHEAWGWALEGKGSLGSALYASPHDALAKKVASQMVRCLNERQQLTGTRRFVARPDDDREVVGTLGQYCAGRRRSRYPGLHYILCEVTGQNDVQALQVRVGQLHELVLSLLSLVGASRSTE